MRGKKPDHEILNQAFKPIESGGMDYLPIEVEQRLQECSVEELHRLFIQGCNLTSMVMAQKGWILMMIKRQVGHGHFKAHLAELKVSYKYANQCMNVARAIGQHPDLAKIGDTNLLRRVAYLPDSKQENIAIKLKQTVHTLENGKLSKRTEEWHDLRPWILEQIGHAFEKDGRSKPRKKPKGPLPPIPSKLLQIATQAQSALRQISYYEIPQSDYPYLEQLRLELQHAWDRAIYNLTYPKHDETPPWELGNSDDVSGTFSDEEIEKLREELGLQSADPEELED